MKSTTPRTALVLVSLALALAACDEPTAPLAPSARRSSLDAGSVAGSAIAFLHVTPTCGVMSTGCSDEPGGLGWSMEVSLATIGVDGTGLVDLTYPVNAIYPFLLVFAPAWSPDGMRIAYDAGDILVLAGAGGTPVNLTRHPADDRHPTWSPDGGRIAFGSDRGGSRDLYVMSATDGSNVTRLTNGVGFSGHPDWSADGARILFDCIVEAGNSDICAVNADGTGFVRLTSHPGSDRSADWSPTGGIAFVTTRFSAAPEIAVMTGDGTGVTRLGAGAIGEEPDWAPDGAHLAFSRDQHVYIMAADGSNPTWLVGGSSPSWRPTDTPLPPPNHAPVARFTFSCVRTKCTFDGRSSTDDKGIVSYSWNAGSSSGGHLTGAVVTHDYKRAGTYTASLTVLDAEGVSSSVSQIVTVTK